MLAAKYTTLANTLAAQAQAQATAANNSYFVIAPTKAQGIVTPTPQGNLNKAITLILQLLPLVQGNGWLTPAQATQVVQALLKAAYTLQIAACTHYTQHKVGYKATQATAAPQAPTSGYTGFTGFGVGFTVQKPL